MEFLLTRQCCEPKSLGDDDWVNSRQFGVSFPWYSTFSSKFYIFSNNKTFQYLLFTGGSDVDEDSQRKNKCFFLFSLYITKKIITITESVNRSQLKQLVCDFNPLFLVFDMDEFQLEPFSMSKTLSHVNDENQNRDVRSKIWSKPKS